MNPVLKVALAIAALAVLITACKKGDTGAAGPVGEPGARIYSGTGVPEVTLGKAGDFYFDTEAKDMYGPKRGRDWGNPVSLVGATGPQGEPGSRIIHGSGMPDAATGREGDYYLDQVQALLYGPKTNGNWGDPVGLKGPAGNNGANGNTILNGPQAPVNSQGTVGDFYLNTTTLELYGPRTTAGWGDPINIAAPNPVCNLVLPSVSFKGSSTQISSDNEAILAAVGNTLRNSPACKVRVTGGYCGDTQESRLLSWRRVNAVISYLVQQEGISADRFIFKYNQPGGSCGIVDLQSAAPGEAGAGIIPPMP
ncbi:OmpA family protein [Niabella aurantiaca]|uniref:OmpA family protein n=1 Tax=Niabella aurantiaca TaxID=379900 RepID=UPI00035ECCA6|nr:OmpA family protein [Niabella aurantiaca]